jgi:Protein of unknown function (DUF1822)
MLNSTVAHSFFLPITQACLNTAAYFSQKQPSAEKAEQVRLNTLAVCVVNNYLQMLGIATDLKASDSWNPLLQLCADTADLEVIGCGRLECRPLEMHLSTCYVPPEVWEDRIGYVVVRVDESRREANLLGFVTHVSNEELAISQLQPLEKLCDRLSQQSLVNLSEWLDNIFTSGWQSVEALFGNKYTNLAYRFRSSGNRDEPNFGDKIKRAKLIDLGIQLGNYPLALIVEINSKVNLTNIHLQLHPAGELACLPPNVQLIVLDESGEIFMSATSQDADNYIQLYFNGESKEQFSVRITLGLASITETFVI